jgi:two-component system, chemotaxis family, sensor kinase CheA
MDEIVKDFLIESAENLDRLDQELVKLESEPSSKSLLDSIFRTIHTIKGTCGFLGFTRLEKVAHAGENLLSRLRDGKLSLTSEITSVLLAMVDAVRQMLSEIQATEQDGAQDYAPLQEELKRLQEGTAPATTSAESLPHAAVLVAEAANTMEEPSAPAATSAVLSDLNESAPSAQSVTLNGETAVVASPEPENSKSQNRPMPGSLGALLVENGKITPEDLALALCEQDRGDQRRVGEILVALGCCKTEDVTSAQQTIAARGREGGAETVRVGVTLLDKLMNLVGELVLARNQLLQSSSGMQDAGFQAIAQRMNLIASELQEEVMKTRMQPIGNIWSKFPRTVRDLAHTCGKEVRLEMQGQETELDRTIIEAIKDPLTHLVRNSVDHGIEMPEARARAKKDRCGRLILRAFHEGGQVNIEIADDGAGLDSERIRKKAVERGLISAQLAASLPESDLFNLIFLPGFSTAEKITNVSGRGVGMDVVKTNIEKIGGLVDIHSAKGKGTTVRVKIPLTLAIIPALLVRCREERFAIPQVSLLELVRLAPGDRDQSIEMVHGSPVFRLRGRLLPLIYLDRELQLPLLTDPAQTTNIVVLQAEGRKFGLVVDEITDTAEIVVKPLAKQLKGIAAYSGATIMGDGRVALILDVLGLAQRAQVLAKERESVVEERNAGLFQKKAKDEQPLLLAENGYQRRIAIPLGLVARLEEFPATVVERAGSQEVMQYRGRIIPLIRLSQVVQQGCGPTSAPSASTAEGSPAKPASIQVVVYSEDGRTVGLIVDRILDIIEQQTLVESVAVRAGVTGSFVAQKYVTDLLDVPAIVRASAPGYLEAVAAGTGQKYVTGGDRASSPAIG